MADEGGMDPCECIWSHELAMRRLLNIIRNSQSSCTDSECFSTDYQNGTNTNVWLLTILFCVGFLLYFFNPRAVRIADDSAKPRNDFNGSPPTPPPSIS